MTHFFAPAWRNPAVEVIRWNKVDPAVVEYLRWVFCMTGKVPLVTADVACFMLDRIFDNWCNESALLLDRATAAEVDSVAAEFVHAGPFFVLNLAHGNPIITETNTLQADEEGEHYSAGAGIPFGRHLDHCGARQAGPGGGLARAVRDRLLGILFSQRVDIVDRGIGDAGRPRAGLPAGPGFQERSARADAQARRDGAGRTLNACAGAARYADAGRHSPPTRDSAHILVDEVDGVRVITLRRPEALNALHDEMTDEILAAIRECENDARILASCSPATVRGRSAPGLTSTASCLCWVTPRPRPSTRATARACWSTWTR